MWIEKLDVYGFGMLQDLDMELGRGLNVIAAGNGQGKTTLFNFIRACLFGFAHRRSVQRYELDQQPFRGGRLFLGSNGERIQVERVPKGPSAGSLHIGRRDGSSADEDFLKELLGGMPQQVYQQVFALGLDELARLDVFSRDELRSHLLSVGLHAADSIAAMDKSLQSQRDELFKPRGQQPVLNRRLRSIDEIKDRLGEAERRERTYADTEKKLAGLEARIGKLTSDLEGLQAKADELRAQAEAWPYWVQWQEADKEMAALDSLRRVSERVCVPQASEALHSFQRLRSERVWADAAVVSARDQLRRWQESMDHLQSQRRQLLPEPLRALQSSERTQLLEQCRAQQEKIKASALPGGWVALAGVFYTGTLLYLWLWRGLSGWSGLLALLPLITAAAVAAARFHSGRQVQEEWRRLEPFFGDWPVDIGVWQARLDEDERLGQECRDLQRQLDDAAYALKDAEAKAHAVVEKCREWMVCLNAGSEEETEKALQALCRYESLAEEAQRLAHGVELCLGMKFPEAEPKMRSARKEDIEKEMALVGERRAALEEERRQCLEERGRLQKELDDMESQGRVDHWRRQLTEEKHRAQPELQRLAAVAVLQQAVEQARQEFETTRQPELLRKAGRWFAAFTQGAYHRVYVPFQERQIKAEDRDGFVWHAERLSRGTVEQLYLALRFALIQYYADSGVVLPVLLDEILVNFDPARTENVLDGLCQLSNTHQILLLTCKEDMLELAQGRKEVTICRPFRS